MRREGQVCGCCEEGGAGVWMLLGGRGRCVDAVRREGQVCGCC